MRRRKLFLTTYIPLLLPGYVASSSSARSGPIYEDIDRMCTYRGAPPPPPPPDQLASSSSSTSNRLPPRISHHHHQSHQHLIPNSPPAPPPPGQREGGGGGRRVLRGGDGEQVRDSTTFICVRPLQLHEGLCSLLWAVLIGESCTFL